MQTAAGFPPLFTIQIKAAGNFFFLLKKLIPFLLDFKFCLKTAIYKQCVFPFTAMSIKLRWIKSTKILTFAPKLHFGASLSTFLLVSNETLVHAFVVFAHRFDFQDASIVAGNGFTVFQPRNRLHRITFGIAGQRSRSSEVYGLYGRFHSRR